MKPHKHAALIKQWADGAEIQVFSTPDGWIPKREYVMFNVEHKYRVKPDCEYAFNKIREIGGKEAVELYKYWLDGGEVERKYAADPWKTLNVINDDPFFSFKISLVNDRQRKKKRTVKQVLWVHAYLNGKDT